MSPTAATPVPVRTSVIPHGGGFWVIALAFLSEMAFCAVPTPLYAIYQERDGFPTIVLTVIFAVYAVGVMLSLALAGHLSDWFGRRRVILVSLLLNLLAAILFTVWNDVAGLIVARFVSGLGIGILTATATAHLSELGAVSGRTPAVSNIISTFANLGGISLGPLVAALIATSTTQPLIVPYLAFAILFVLEGIAVALVPETVERAEERPPYRPQRIAVPAETRGAYLAAVAAAFGAFAVFGTFTGLTSTFLGGILHIHSTLLAGVGPFIVFMAAAVAQIVTVRLPRSAQLGLAIALAVLGLLVVGLGALLVSLALFLIGAGLAGAGVGILFRGALGTVGAIADPAHRGEALAGAFLIAYAGMTIPPLVTAGALALWPQPPVLVVFTVLVAALVAVSGARMLRR